MRGLVLEHNNDFKKDRAFENVLTEREKSAGCGNRRTCCGLTLCYSGAWTLYVWRSVGKGIKGASKTGLRLKNKELCIIICESWVMDASPTPSRISNVPRTKNKYTSTGLWCTHTYIIINSLLQTFRTFERRRRRRRSGNGMVAVYKGTISCVLSSSLRSLLSVRRMILRPANYPRRTSCASIWEGLPR